MTNASISLKIASLDRQLKLNLIERDILVNAKRKLDAMNLGTGVEQNEEFLHIEEIGDDENEEELP